MSGRLRGRSALGLAVCLLTLVSAAPAGAAITGSTITSPGSGAELFYNGDSGSGSLTVRGTVSGASAGAAGDLLCYSVSDTRFTRVASGIDVASGSFAFSASLSPIAGFACRLALVPAGATPTGAAAAPFTGPAISVTDQFSHSSSGDVYGYYILAGTLPWSFAFQSLGDCPVLSSFATDTATLGSFSLFAGNACLPQTSGAGPAAGTRSALQIDGLNAYPPAAISTLTDQAGFEPLIYTTSFDAAHDTVTINEIDIPTICNSPATYPPTTATCPALHDSGILVQQTTTLLPGGEVARVSQRFTSVDGRAHSIDALFGQSVQAPASGETPGFAFPRQTSFATHSKPDSFSTFPGGPSSIIVIADASAAPATSNPIGAITYSRPPVSADFVTGAGAQTSTLLMHYVDSIPARGSVVYNWSFSQAASNFGLTILERIERDRFFTPSVHITSPRNKSTTRNAKISVRGRAFDAVGLTSLTVGGRGVALTGSGAFASTLKLRPGKHVIVVTARNVAGNASSSSVTITYKPPPCRVPRLRGKTLRTAKRALASSSCDVGKVTRVHSRRIRKGRVVSSKPAAGTTHRRGTKVSLVISRGG
jgi:hypothetical protein